MTSDTKVVERGKGDGIFVHTSGLGQVEAPTPIDPTRIEPGDAVLVSGDLGRHGLTILVARHGLDLQPPMVRDCAPLWPAVERLLVEGVRPHCLRDLTRGGLACAMHELAVARGVELSLEAAAPGSARWGRARRRCCYARVSAAIGCCCPPAASCYRASAERGYGPEQRPLP